MVFNMPFFSFSVMYSDSVSPPCAPLLRISVSFDGVLAFLLLTAVSVLILKSFGFRGAPLVTVIAIVCTASYYSEALFSVGSLFGELSDTAEVGKYVSAALKIVGISYLSGISRDVCLEIGESGIAKAVSVVTKLELILLTVPYIKEILSSLLLLLSS